MKPPASTPVDVAAIRRAVEILRRGGLVAVPTETVYGLAADADNAVAVRKVFAAKGRPADHPVIVHVADRAQAMPWVQAMPASASTLIDAFWPGPLTIVLPRSSRAHDLLTGGQPSIALRSPAHPWARALLLGFGGALAAPSANRFGFHIGANPSGRRRNFNVIGRHQIFGLRLNMLTEILPQAARSNDG
jgi:L-threonylcarbamoyladenylate synthase